MLTSTTKIAKLKAKLSNEKLHLGGEIQSPHNVGEVGGNSPPLCQVLKQVEVVAPIDSTVLILWATRLPARC